jgi:hypothetical protein
MRATLWVNRQSSYARCILQFVLDLRLTLNLVGLRPLLLDHCRCQIPQIPCIAKQITFYLATEEPMLNQPIGEWMILGFHNEAQFVTLSGEALVFVEERMRRRIALPILNLAVRLLLYNKTSRRPHKFSLGRILSIWHHNFLFKQVAQRNVLDMILVESVCS